jgi:uncharacterized protein
MRRFDSSKLSGLIPLFPLPNCVLLPRAALPLHVFEPRYRQLTADLLDKPARERLVGVALLTKDYENSYYTNEAPIPSVVGVGEMVQCEVLPDGRFNIVLLGQARARILRERPADAYRMAKLKFIPTEPRDMLSSVDGAVDEVRNLLKEMSELGVCDRELVDGIMEISASAATMVDLATFHLIDGHNAIVKQRILEEEDLEVRADVLAHHLQQITDAWRVAQAMPEKQDDWPPKPEAN